MTGRRPKPVSLHKLNGTYRKDLHGDRVEAEVIKRVPPVPARLRGYPDGAKEWRRIVPELKRLGVLSKSDLTSLERYCIIYDRWIRAERDVLKNGFVQTTPSGYQQANPAIGVVNKCIDQLYKLSGEFGLSPAAKAKIKVSPETKEDRDLLTALDDFSKRRIND